MHYSQLIQRLFRVNLFEGVKLGLQNVERLQRLLDYPDRKFRSIHVAGTNGKGSVSTKIAAAFSRAGYRTGLFTSPHIATFRERIQIDGKMISQGSVESILTRLFAVVDQEGIPATFFELTTLLAFLYFSQEGVEIAVLEAGLGGRLDATNVVSPVLAVITSIGLDHTEILGANVEAIAVEKAGIIKENTPVIIGPRVPLAPVQVEALRKHSPYTQVTGNFFLFEEENRAVARAALNFLASPFGLADRAIEEGLQQTPPCRCELLEGNPRVVLDVAHNPDGLCRLFRTLRHRAPGSSLRVVFGLSKSKDLKGCTSLIALHAHDCHLVEAANGRGVSVAELHRALLEAGVEASRAAVHDSISEGVERARRTAAKEGQLLVICGSFFIMAEARQALGLREPRDDVDLNELFRQNVNLTTSR